MVKTKKLLKELIIHFLKLINLIFKKLLIFIAVKILYWVTHEKGEIDGILSKRKYRRMKQSFRYKIWFWENMRWLCKYFDCNFEYYMKFKNNKEILKY